MQVALIFAVFVVLSLAFGIFMGVRHKGLRPSRIIVGCIAAFAAFVVFYTIIFPAIGSWLMKQMTP